MLHIYQSCSLQQLYEDFRDQLKCSYEAENIQLFDQLNVLVQSPAMEKWLQVKLCQDLGVLANINFPMPASYIWNLYTQCLDSKILEHTNLFTKPSMCWQLMTIIEESFDELPSETQEHLTSIRANHAHSNHLLLQFQFCQTMADVFDQYLVFRPQWLRLWENNQLHDPTSKDEAWQAQLWRLLVNAHLHETHLAHRVRLNDKTIDLLTSTSKKPELPTHSIYIFALSSLAPQHLQILHALAQHIDIHFYLQTPSPHYFADLASTRKQAWIHSHEKHSDAEVNWDDLHFCEGNPLVASMSAPIKQLSEQLSIVAPQGFQHNEDDMEDLNEIKSTLLTQTQYEIRQLSFAGQLDSWFDKPLEPNYSIDQDDQSLQIHACHSRQRELEVAHNQLLKFFAEDDSLTPDDVLIMAPNPADYAQHIRSVFGANSKQPAYLPIALTDTNLLDDSALIQNFVNLLDITKNRFKVTQIADLLQQPAVYQCWDFNEEERNIILRWIDKHGIHWAWDEAEKVSYNLPSSKKFTWTNAIQQSALSIMMNAQAGIFNGQLVQDQISSSDENLWGRWFDFLHAIYDLSQDLKKEKTIGEWIENLSFILKTFFDVKDIQSLSRQDQHALMQLQKIFTQIAQPADLNSYERKLPLSIIQSLLREEVSKPLQSFQLISGKINFSSLLPMRGIPFKVICLLGMNDGEYPSPDTQIEFNLMRQTPRELGDRSRREEDAHQFLQAIISAQEKLHISYIGKSIKDNSPINPSSFVQEVIHYLDQSCIESHKAILFQHPLYSFNPLYFQPKNARSNINFDPLDYACALSYTNNEAKESYIWNDALSDENLTAPSSTKQPENSSLNLADIISFYKNYSRKFCHAQEIYLELDEHSLLDSEPLSIESGLLKYNYFNDAIEHIKNNSDSQDWIETTQLQNDIPDGKNASRSVYELHQQAETVLLSAQESVSLNSEIIHQTVTMPNKVKDGVSDIQILCQLELFNGSTLLRVKPNSAKPHDYLQLWLQHLCASITRTNVESYLAYSDGSKTKKDCFSPVEKQQAVEHLQTFLNYYKQHQQSYLAFDIAISYAYAKEFIKSADKDTSLKSAYKALESSYSPYSKFCLNQEIIQSDAFHQVANNLLSPMLNMLNVKSVKGAKK